MPKKANPTARDTKNPLIFDTIKKKYKLTSDQEAALNNL